MPIVIRDVVTGALKLNGLPDRECFKSWIDFLQRIPDLFSVEIPNTLGGVISQQGEPNEDSRGKLWLRLDGSGRILGLYAFQDGKWQPFYSYPEGAVIWMTGNSNQVPVGFTLIEPGDATIVSGVVSALVAQYIPISGGPGYAYFATRFTGF